MTKMGASERIGRLLRPRSIAIVGASTAANKMAGQLIPALRLGGYVGHIYPVNPRYQEVGDLPCFASLRDIGAEIDHCIIAVGRDRVPAVLADCRALGVAGASIYSSGYAESGAEDGAAAQVALQEAAGDLPFIGPNCMGFANLVDHVIAAPASILRRALDAGDVALISQSGGLAFATLGFFAIQAGMRFSYIINTGNSAGISYTDLVEYMFDDEATRVIIAVAESDRAAGEIIAAVRWRGLVKPIVLLKLGRGDTGRRMALSHTGSLAGDDRPARDCARQFGIVMVDDTDEALACADLLRNGFGPEAAHGLAAISISGGNVTLFADHADMRALDFAHLSEATEARLRRQLPDYISVHNPVDITALGYEEPELHAGVLEALVADPAVHAVVPIITTAEDYTPVCSLLARVRTDTGCAMIALWTGGSYETRSREILREAGIPVIHSAGLLARALAAMGAAQPTTNVPPPAALVPALPHGGSLTEAESMEFLAAAGLSVPSRQSCGRDDLAAAAAAVGYPIVVKADSAETHLSDRGGVVLGVRDEADLARAAAAIAGIPGERLLVSRYLPGEELIASVFTHPSYGRLLMIGSGGRLADLLADVRFVALPAGRDAITAALGRTMVGRALASGYRGAQGHAAAVDLLVQLGAIGAASAATVEQIELNPVTVGAHGAAAVDALVVAS
jgi:acyl-CoA synthetase (NDP forming)